MEPVAIATAILAALYIVGRGPLVVAPAATVACYRHMLSSPRRFRIFGGLMALLAIALVMTARQARVAHGDITFLPEAFGWLAGVAAIVVLVVPGAMCRLMNAFWDAIPTPELRRAIGALNVALGLFLGWVAFFEL